MLRGLVPGVVLLALSSHALNNGLGATPALGWSSWNYFTYSINQAITLQIAEALVSLGLRVV